MQISPAHAERILEVLIRTRSVSVERNGKALNSDACNSRTFLSIDQNARQASPFGRAMQNLVSERARRVKR